MPKPTRALIVDDESHARTYVRLLLKEVGIDHVWEAGDGPQAMASFVQHRPELVILDVNLRATTGLQLLQQMKQERPEVLVIMLTSENAMKTVGEASRLGADGYILKQSPRHQALESLREILDGAADDDDRAAESGSGS
jgi:two-component system, chemotaxis family, chemotaxis protein CheY